MLSKNPKTRKNKFLKILNFENFKFSFTYYFIL